MRFQPTAATALIAIAILAACGGRGKAEGPWEFKVDSSAGAKPAASLRSVGQEGPRGEPQKNPVVLSLDCRADHTGATILTQQSLRQGSVDAEMTLDAAKARKIPGFAGTTGSSGQLVPFSTVVPIGDRSSRAMAWRRRSASRSKPATWPSR